MATSSTPSSALTRYRPVVLSIAGVAAIYGIYLIYTTSKPVPAPPLHRSGAVHRRRRNARHERVEPSPSVTEGQPELSSSATFGHLEYTNSEGQRLLYDLRADSLPTLDDFINTGSSAEDAQRGVDRAQGIFLDRFFAVVLGRAELNGGGGPMDRGRINPVDRSRICDWLMGHGVTVSNLESALDRYNAIVQRVLQEEGGDLQGPSLMDEVYGQQANSVPATEVAVHHRQREAEGQNLKQLLYYIAEEQSKQEGYIHRGVCCNGCETKPIRGTRWRCANCPDFDLCSDCHSVGSHWKTHIFYEVKIPAPSLGNVRQALPVAYPGIPDHMPRTLPPDVCKRLVSETNFEKSEVEGLYDQFTCIASYRWPTDPNKIGAAIDRQSFEVAFVPLHSFNPPRPNLIYDRMFAFYDSNGDGLIGFEEFVQGLATTHMKSKASNKPLKVFAGYDVDADGYVSRKDFLRMFRALYAIQKEATRDLLAVQEDKLTIEGAMDLIASSAPLSSAFTSQIPPGSQDAPEGKAPDDFGDRRGAQSPVLESAEDRVDRAGIVGHAWESQAGFPFDPETGEPRTQRPWTIQIGEEDREVQFAYGDRPVVEARGEAVRERWRRRQFYTDEEEGFHLANGDVVHDEEDDVVRANLPSPALRHTPEGSRPASPRSRSSSKVRFQDDVEFDTRSNASTSSRPFNERYGGYEIPEAEKDFGGEILYQVMEDGMNELLDALFKEKEDLAMEVFATKYERRKWKAQIAAYKEKQQKENEAIARAARDPLLATAEAVESQNNSSIPLPPLNGLDVVSQLVVNQGVEEAISHVEQRVNSQSLEELLREAEYLFTPLQSADVVNATSNGVTFHQSSEERAGSPARNQQARDEENTGTWRPIGPSSMLQNHLEPFDVYETSGRWAAHYDPTMPQFRPNSNSEPRPLHFDPTHFEHPTSSRQRTSANVAHHSDHLDSRGAVPGSERDITERFASLLLGWEHEAAVPLQSNGEMKANGAITQATNTSPDDARLAKLAQLDDMNHEIDIRGGPGRLSFAEFEALVKEEKGLGIVEEWLGLGSF